VILAAELIIDFPYITKCAIHCKCDATSTVTTPVIKHCNLVDTNTLHCLVTQAQINEQLAYGCYTKVEWTKLNLRPLDHKSKTLTVTKPWHMLHTHEVEFK